MPALPMAMIFTNQLLLTWRGPEQSNLPAEEMKFDSLTIWANRLTVVLKEIEGYNHDGLNE